MTEYKPGTVARVTLTRKTSGERALDDVAIWDSVNEEWVGGESGRIFPSDLFVADVRPLVVLDLGDSAQIDQFCKVLVEAMHAAGDRYSAANGVHPATVRAALDSLTKPPRIDEPGLWGVVEAHTANRETRVKFVRRYDKHNAGYDWTSIESLHPSTGNSLHWSELLNPVLVREGVVA